MNKPDFYRYIALLDYEKDGVHVTFPDLPGCVTFGQDEEPSTIKNLSSSQKLKDNETFFLVDAFMPPIRERMAKQFVKKTLSIPAWLNSQAESYGINFSQTLQKALKQELSLAQ